MYNSSYYTGWTQLNFTICPYISTYRNKHICHPQIRQNHEKLTLSDMVSAQSLEQHSQILEMKSSFTLICQTLSPTHAFMHRPHLSFWLPDLSYTTDSRKDLAPQTEWRNWYQSKGSEYHRVYQLEIQRSMKARLATAAPSSSQRSPAPTRRKEYIVCHNE